MIDFDGDSHDGFDAGFGETGFFDADDAGGLDLDMDHFGDGMHLNCYGIDGVELLYCAMMQEHSFFSHEFYTGDAICPEVARKRLSQKDKAVKAASEKAQLRRYYGVHVSGHAQVNLINILETSAQEAGLVNLLGPRKDRIQQRINAITDWNRTEPPFLRGVNPNGWFPGVEGHTQVVKQCWQVPKRTLFNRKRVPDRNARTWLEITITNWNYNQTCDAETRIDIYIKSLLAYSDMDKQWAPTVAFYPHKEKAIELEKKLLSILKGFPPSEASRMLREYYRPVMEAPCACHDIESASFLPSIEPDAEPTPEEPLASIERG